MNTFQRSAGAFTLCIMSAGGMAQGGPVDPTLPPPAWLATGQQAVTPNSSLTSPGLTTQQADRDVVPLVLLGNGRRLALVGGSLQRVGNRADNGTVTGISRTAVTLRSDTEVLLLPVQSPAVAKILRR